MVVQALCSPGAAPTFINGALSEDYEGPLADDLLLSNAGGGAALLYASKELTKLSEKAANFDQKIGYQIIQNALKVRAQFVHGCRPSDSWSMGLSHADLLLHFRFKSYKWLKQGTI